MQSVQYTVRDVPPEVDKALRRKAQRAGKSLNAVAREALAGGRRGGGDGDQPDRERLHQAADIARRRAALDPADRDDAAGHRRAKIFGVSSSA